jgi:hypothetical protein
MRRRRFNDASQTSHLINDAHEANVTWIFQNNERKEENHRKKKKIEFRQMCRFFIDSSSRFWRLIAWAKNKNHKSKEISKILVLTRKNAIETIFKTIEDFSFKIEMLHHHFFSDTAKTNFINMQTFNYRVFVEKSKINIQKNEIKQVIKRCKSNNASKFDDILNKILKILFTEIMLSLINQFQAYIKLNYHFLCFRIARIIVFKKFNKKNYSKVKTYKFVILLNTLNKILKLIITRRINNLTKIHDMFFVF